MISNFLFSCTNFCVIVCFLTKPLTFGISFSTAVNPELVAKPLMLGILFSISVILALKSAFLTKLLVSGIIYSASLILFSRFHLSVSYVDFITNPVVSILFTFVTNLLHSVFLTTSFFTTLLNLAKSSGTGVHFAMTNLSYSVFKLARFVFDAKLLTSTCVTFLNQFSLHNCLDLISL